MDTPGAAAAVAELESLGARVTTVVPADVSEERAVRRVLESVPSDLPLRGVVHAAGIIDDGMLSRQLGRGLIKGQP
jgi:hypothetical protein